MSGARLSVELDGADAVARGLTAVAMSVHDATPLMKMIGAGLKQSIKLRFAGEVDPDGNPWAPLDPDYELTKHGNQILTDYRTLRQSNTSLASPTRVEVGNNLRYGPVHQFGSKKKNITARPYLGISREDEEMILDAIEHFLERAARAG
jgi:phage virion morphogenesis protein